MVKKEVADFFDAYTDGFNAIYGTRNNLFNRVINKLFRKSIRVRYKKTIEGCTPLEGKTVLDVGCGPGHYCITLAQKGAKVVTGIDFAPRMIELAKKNAASAGVENKCNFITGDFMETGFEKSFDYSIVMGFMDYVRKPETVVRKVLGITDLKAFFSFPKDTGFLAFQRKLRYKRKCDLFLYNRDQLEGLFSKLRNIEYDIEKIHRDYFVTVLVKKPNSNF
ncbi:methyltransferase domain-containing protein [bacterium]|nr:methyltransferase domain-containing protein [bacterium]